MTTLDALKANVSQVHGLVISDNAFLKALVDEDLAGSETYSKTEYEQIVDMATIRIYRQIIGAAGFSEGDVSYSPKEVKSAVDYFLIKWGLLPEFGSPSVKGVNVW